MADRKPVLVIGYGNTLRGDDGAGPEVARILVDFELPFVEIHQATQLMPELAELVTNAHAVIFVDAKPASDATTVTIDLLEPAALSVNPAHSISPSDILRLAIDCYGHAPPSWLVGIGGDSFCFSNNLSSRAQLNVTRAVRLIKNRIQCLVSTETVPSRTRAIL